MALSMYAASVPLFKQMFGSMTAVLDKGAAYAAAKSVDEKVLVGARLAWDMLPLSKQVQIASDQAKGAVARLAGLDIPGYADDETTIEDLKARIAKTVAFIDAVKPEQINGSEDRAIILKLRAGEQHFTGERYLIGWAIPQFMFHCATAYDILRHNGVEIGKRDFIGAF
jgi:hypothetical protein